MSHVWDGAMYGLAAMWIIDAVAPDMRPGWRRLGCTCAIVSTLALVGSLLRLVSP